MTNWLIIWIQAAKLDVHCAQQEVWLHAPCQQPDPQTGRVLQSENNQPPHYWLLGCQHHQRGSLLFQKILRLGAKQVCFICYVWKFACVHVILHPCKRLCIPATSFVSVYLLKHMYSQINEGVRLYVYIHLQRAKTGAWYPLALSKYL